MFLWVEVCLQGHRPQLGEIYREPLVHIELVALSQDAASGGPPAKLTPARPGRAELPAQGCHVHWGNFTLPIYENVSLSIKSIFGT